MGGEVVGLSLVGTDVVGVGDDGLGPVPEVGDGVAVGEEEGREEVGESVDGEIELQGSAAPGSGAKLWNQSSQRYKRTEGSYN